MYTYTYICIYIYIYVCVCGVYEVYKPHIPPAVLMALWLDRSMTSPPCRCFPWIT